MRDHKLVAYIFLGRFGGGRCTSCMTDRRRKKAEPTLYVRGVVAEVKQWPTVSCHVLGMQSAQTSSTRNSRSAFDLRSRSRKQRKLDQQLAMVRTAPFCTNEHKELCVAELDTRIKGKVDARRIAARLRRSCRVCVTCTQGW